MAIARLQAARAGSAGRPDSHSPSGVEDQSDGIRHVRPGFLVVEHVSDPARSEKTSRLSAYLLPRRNLLSRRAIRYGRPTDLAGTSLHPTFLLGRELDRHIEA